MELFTNAFNYVIRFFTNIIYSVFNPLINSLFTILPDLDMSQLDFTILDNFVIMFNYILDFLMVDKYVIYYAVGSVIFRITYKVLAFPIKLVVAWWHNLAP